MELLDVANESKRARRRDFLEEVVVVIIEMKDLLADGGMVEIDFVLQHQPITGRHANALSIFDDFDRLANPQRSNFGAQLANAGGIDEMHERQRAAVNDRNFRAVDVNVDVSDPASHDRGENMLHRSDRDIILADCRRMIERGRRRLQRRDSQTIEIRSDEGEASAQWSGPKFDGGVDA